VGPQSASHPPGGFKIPGIPPFLYSDLRHVIKTAGSYFTD
jgi:hypothetical protein